MGLTLFSNMIYCSEKRFTALFSSNPSTLLRVKRRIASGDGGFSEDEVVSAPSILRVLPQLFNKASPELVHLFFILSTVEGLFSLNDTTRLPSSKSGFVV